jgi:hypothetical protein
MIISVIEQVLLFLIYCPIGYNNTYGYRRTVEAILKGWTYLHPGSDIGFTYSTVVGYFSPEQEKV